MGERVAHGRERRALERPGGGGGIDQELLGILAGRQYRYTVSRDVGFQQPRPQNFSGPMVVMQNERSASDAEMFAAGFKALGLGKGGRRPDHGSGDVLKGRDIQIEKAVEVLQSELSAPRRTTSRQ